MMGLTTGLQKLYNELKREIDIISNWYVGEFTVKVEPYVTTLDDVASTGRNGTIRNCGEVIEGCMFSTTGNVWVNKRLNAKLMECEFGRGLQSSLYGLSGAKQLERYIHRFLGQLGVVDSVGVGMTHSE